MKKQFLLAIFFLATTNYLSAQTNQQNAGWLFLLNSTKFNEKWGMHLDVQVRSMDEWDGVKNVLIRPGITYYINKNQNVTAGYLLVTQKRPVGGPSSSVLEQRIWEQYILSHKINSAFINHRFRLEQRFFNNVDHDLIQRFRYFFRVIKPLQKPSESFSNGPFLALQNEVFFNIQNSVNDSFFDQNRAYLALGYRFSKQFDIEAGYLNQYVKGITSNTTNHVAQLALYTRF